MVEDTAITLKAYSQGKRMSSRTRYHSSKGIVRITGDGSRLVRRQRNSPPTKKSRSDQIQVFSPQWINAVTKHLQSCF